ncbi:MAG: hypothetical protein ACK4NZ_10390 [Tsuneonella sp.]
MTAAARLVCACPNCGSEIAVSIAAVPREPLASVEPQEWLAPGQLADRLGIGEPYVRKLCSRGARAGDPGIRREGGRWLATIDTIDRLRRV